MKKRYSSLDILRVLAVFIIIIYHMFVIIGLKTNIKFINNFIYIFGEIGVTLFFIISGISIYLSLNKSKGNISYKEFIKKRFKRILPEYYYCLIVCLIITSSSVYLTKKHLLNILLHFLLIHNFHTYSHGAINGSLWTMGVIFQFYLISIILYKWINKNPKIVTFSSIVITISLKFIIYNFIVKNNFNLNYIFIYGRQLFTSIDNFVLGLLIGKIITTKVPLKKNLNIISLFIGVILFALPVYLSFKYNIYDNDLIGYTWHSLLAISLFLIILPFITIDFKNSRLLNVVKFFAKYEYGIYLWHLVIITSVINSSFTIQQLIIDKNYIVYLIIFIITVFGSLIMTYVFNKYIVYLNERNISFFKQLKQEIEEK